MDGACFDESCWNGHFHEVAAGAGSKTGPLSLFEQDRQGLAKITLVELYGLRAREFRQSSAAPSYQAGRSRAVEAGRRCAGRAE